MATSQRFAIVGDLVKSRSAGERSSLARQIRSVLRKVQSDLADEFLAPPVLTKGIDELSAVMKRPDRIFDLMVTINLQLWPHRFRFGVGEGTIDVGARSGDAAQMDGTAFHRAADALRGADADKRALVLAVDADEIEISLIESLASGHRAIASDWSPSMAKVAITFRQLQSQIKTARKLKVSQQFVSKELQRGHHQSMLDMEEAATRWFSSLHDRYRKG